MYFLQKCVKIINIFFASVFINIKFKKLLYQRFQVLLHRKDTEALDRKSVIVLAKLIVNFTVNLIATLILGL